MTPESIGSVKIHIDFEVKAHWCCCAKITRGKDCSDYLKTYFQKSNSKVMTPSSPQRSCFP